MAAALAAVLALPAAASAASDSIVVAQGGGAGGPATANRRDAGRSQRFDMLDRNRDGYISRDEAKDADELQTRFSELDTNNDGKLSREEYDALDDHGSLGATGGKGGDASASGANSK